MSAGRLAFRLADLDEGVRVWTCCRSCGEHRALDFAGLPPGAKTLELRVLERKLLCQWRGYDRRKPPCGGRVELMLVGVEQGRSALRDYDYGT